MPLDNSVPSWTRITGEQFRQYIQSQKESDYLVVDVRQTEEYLHGHIPGARLIPLGEIEAYASELKKYADRELIFYCRGGVRSERACKWAAQNLPGTSIKNLEGGFLAWQGPTLSDFPRAASFDLDGPVEVLLQQALGLEKGTHRLYELMAKQYTSGIVGEAIAALVSAEVTHGEAVYQLLVQVTGNSGEGFEATFSKLSGIVTENGVPVQAILSQAKTMGRSGEQALLDLALEIELGAYDLYKNIALSISEPQAREVLEHLAQQEKAHANLVLCAMGDLAKAQAT